MVAQWSDSSQEFTIEIESAESMLMLLEKLSVKIETPALVEIYEPGVGRSIGVGVGRDISVVTYQDSNDPPYFISLGNDKSDAVIVFNYGKEETEYLMRNAIPFKSALLAVESFFRSTGRYEGIAWEKL